MRPKLKLLSDTTTRDEASAAHPPTLASLLGHRPMSSPASTAAHNASSDDVASSDDDVLDVKGVAKLLHVGRNKLYEMVARNQIPHRRFGRCVRFSRAAIMRWLDPCWLQGAKERQ